MSHARLCSGVGDPRPRRSPRRCYLRELVRSGTNKFLKRLAGLEKLADALAMNRVVESLVEEGEAIRARRLPRDARHAAVGRRRPSTIKGSLTLRMRMPSIDRCSFSSCAQASRMPRSGQRRLRRRLLVGSPVVWCSSGSHPVPSSDIASCGKQTSSRAVVVMRRRISPGVGVECSGLGPSMSMSAS